MNCMNACSQLITPPFVSMQKRRRNRAVQRPSDFSLPAERRIKVFSSVFLFLNSTAPNICCYSSSYWSPSQVWFPSRIYSLALGINPLNMYSVFTNASKPQEMKIVQSPATHFHLPRAQKFHQFLFDQIYQPTTTFPFQTVTAAPDQSFTLWLKPHLPILSHKIRSIPKERTHLPQYVMNGRI